LLAFKVKDPKKKGNCNIVPADKGEATRHTVRGVDWPQNSKREKRIRYRSQSGERRAHGCWGGEEEKWKDQRWNGQLLQKDPQIEPSGEAV